MPSQVHHSSQLARISEKEYIYIQIILKKYATRILKDCVSKLLQCIKLSTLHACLLVRLMQSTVILVAVWSKAWVCGSSLAGDCGFESRWWDMEVCLLSVLCFYGQRTLRKDDQSSRRFLPSSMCVCVCLCVIRKPHKGSLGPRDGGEGQP